MAGSTIGTIFKITTWGESHGKGIGVVVDGCPAGLPISEADIQTFLDRRKPGQSKFTTQRQEGDQVEILSGVFEGVTTGAPISMMVSNQDQKSHDYSEISQIYRPGHADFTFDEKYGFRDYRGGGRSSGRETIGRVASGAVAAKFLESLGITVTAYTKAIGSIQVDENSFDIEEIQRNRLYMPDAVAAQKAEQYLQTMIEQKNSAGGIVECVVSHLPTGLGEPVFEKLSANLAKSITSIGAVKGFEIGDGFEASRSTGASNNDSFYIGEDGRILKKTNHSGGVLGGISDGSDLILRAAFKPTPSIASLQNTVTKEGGQADIVIKGRHDPIIVPRAVVVVEAMTALTVTDMLLVSMTSRMDKIIHFFQ